MRKKQILGLIMALVLGVGAVRFSATISPVAKVIDTEAVVVNSVIEFAPDLTVDEVAQVMSETEIVIVDVREDWEYSSGHIAGAVLIPLGEIADRVDEIPTDVPVVLVCRSGNRSSQAYRYLKQQGYENVHNILGGMVDWTGSGYDVIQ